MQLVDAALAKVQLLDPTGVAARDIRECLLIQIAAINIEPDSLVHKILHDHFPLLEKRDFRGLTRALGVPIEEISQQPDGSSHVLATIEMRKLAAQLGIVRDYSEDAVTLGGRLAGLLDRVPRR